MWDDSDIPWLPLATVRLTTVLPDDVTELTQFSIANLPEDTLSFPNPTSNDDFNIVPYLRSEIYPISAKHRVKHPKPPPKGEAVEYLVHVVTGTEHNAANTENKCNIHVCLVGKYWGWGTRMNPFTFQI